MKIYFAGGWTGEWEPRWYAAGLRRRLRSFLKPDLDSLSPDVDLFLDSGAFTAWTKGVTIDLDAYADFVLAHKDRFTVVANLDVIPFGGDVERAAEQGWENYQALTRRLSGAGVIVLHTYHYGENVKWLRKLVDECEYFAIGGIATESVRADMNARRSFLDGIMPLLTDDQGFPIRCFHGFGLTSVSLMRRYPWFSVDSTSWAHAAR